MDPDNFESERKYMDHSSGDTTQRLSESASSSWGPKSLRRMTTGLLEAMEVCGVSRVVCDERASEGA